MIKRKEIIRAENLYQDLLENLEDAVYRINLGTSQYEYISPAIASITGKDASSFVNESDFLNTISDPLFLNLYATCRSEFVNNRQASDIQYKILDSNGQSKWIQQTLRPHFSVSGELVAFEGTYRDVSSSQKVLSDFEVIQERLETAQKIARLGNWEWNIVEDSLWWSEEIYQIFGLDSSVHEPSYEKFLAQSHEDDKFIIEDGVAAALEHKNDYNVEHRIVLADGTVRVVKELAEVVFDDKGPVLMSGTVQDITEAKLVEQELSRHRDELEVLVDERTEHIRALSTNLVEASRRAGMAEIATGVLHNVGNVLNSINTSASLASRYLHQLDSRGLLKACDLLRLNQENLAQFLKENDTGKHLLDYLERLAKYQAGISSDVYSELTSLKENVGHVASIVSMQQSHAHAKGIKETVYLKEAVRQAIAISEVESDQLGIDVVLEVSWDEEIRIEIHKLLQILVNLLTNAKQAIISANSNRKEIHIEAGRLNDQFLIQVEDTGEGIGPAGLKKIFNMGYTTKDDGYGYGLHTSAILATELNGSLAAFSEGKNKGSRFVLTFGD